MSQNAKLAFGVEFELLLKPKAELITRLEKVCPGWAAKFEKAKQAESEVAAQEGSDTNTAKAEADALRLKFREQIATILRSLGGIPTGTTSSKYQEWSVVDEPTLDEVPGYCKYLRSGLTSQLEVIILSLMTA